MLYIVNAVLSELKYVYFNFTEIETAFDTGKTNTLISEIVEKFT